jgi:HEPN domain-containing protein
MDREFPRTHDLQRLLALCQEHDEAFAPLEEDVQFLNGYGVVTRYVDDWREIDAEEAREALGHAHSLKERILQLLAVAIALDELPSTL